MDHKDLEIIQSGDVEQSAVVFKRFVEKHSQTFDFTVFNQSGQWPIIWNSIFNILKSANAHPNIFPQCLASVRILSRNKSNLNHATVDQFDCLLNIANIGTHNVECSSEVSVEALKCLCNLVFQSEKCQAMCLKNASIEGIVKRLRTYKDHNVNYELQFFDMKLLFIITGLNPNVRTKVRDDFHGLTYLVETLDLIMRDQRKQNYLPDKHIDLLCEILKVLFNITVRNETSVATEEEEEIQFRRLSVVLHDLLLCKSYNKDKQSELCSNTVNLLTNVPTACFSELIISIHDDDDVAHIKVFERHDMTAIDVLLAFLKGRLDNVQKLSVQQELLSPILMVLVKCVRSNSIERRYVRSVVLPPLRDVQNRPEVGNELRNQLCRLLTTPATQVRDLTAELLFVICKENVCRMTKYTGYGNAAGLFANRGLLGGHGPGPGADYSSESEDSDTEEYKQIQHAINPVLGCYEPPRPDPFAGISDEQKEYEAMKLVNLMDQLNRQGFVQPSRIGPDGRPIAVEHILELQEGLPQQQLDHKRKT